MPLIKLSSFTLFPNKKVPLIPNKRFDFFLYKIPNPIFELTPNLFAISDAGIWIPIIVERLKKESESLGDMLCEKALHAKKIKVFLVNGLIELNAEALPYGQVLTFIRRMEVFYV